jgi:DNA-binding CsgD family transcriptional regulator
MHLFFIKDGSGIIEALRQRPMLVAVTIILSGAFLSYASVRFVFKTDGLMLIDASPTRAGRVFIGLVVGVWSVLLWRIYSTNRLLRRRLSEKYRAALKAQDTDALREIRAFVYQLRIRGNLLQRLLAVIGYTPLPYVGLFFILTLANLANLFLFYYLRAYPAGTVWRDIFYNNAPWALAMLTILGLVFIDIWILNTLEQKVADIAVQTSAAFRRYLADFKTQLTATECRIMYLRKRKRYSHKEIATALHVSVATVKSHLNHINKKWRAFQRKQEIFLELSDLLAVEDESPA